MADEEKDLPGVKETPVDKDRYREFWKKATKESQDKVIIESDFLSGMLEQLIEFEKESPDEDNIIKQMLDIDDAEARKMPLMINRDWKSDGIKERYMDKMRNIKFPEKE